MTVKDETHLQLKLPSKFQLISYDIILPYEWSLAPKASFTTLVYISLNFFFIISSYVIFLYLCQQVPLKTNWAHCFFFRRFKDGRSKNNYHSFLDLFPSDNKGTAEHSR